MLPVGCSREPFASLWFKPLTVQTYAVCMNQKTADSSTHQRPRAQTPAAPHIGIGANQCKFGKLGRTCRESVFSNDLEASTWARGPSKTAMDEVDMSVFSKMAELLARPLSPTALEKEAKEEAAASRRAPKPRMAKARSGLQNRSGSALEPVRRSPAVTSSDHDTDAKGSILSAVSELSGLQQVWKEKAKHPSYRKAGPPRMKRPPVKVLAEEERLQKMDEIDNLEQQLTEAKNVAAAAREAAAAAERLAQSAEADEDSGSEKLASELLGSGPHEVPQKDGLHRQAEERVKARRQQEAKERREHSRREAEERKKQADAEAKASELERQAKERVQERIRVERTRERLLQEQQERDAEEREKRSRQVAEELRQQALKRLADKDQASRQLAEEMAKQESEARRLQIEESEARAEELRMKTRQRMHQHLREQKEQENAAEEARQRRIEDAARAEEGKIRQALQSQHRAQLRAAQFKHKARSEEQARILLHEEEMERQQEHAESALMERQRKRRWRANLGSKSLTPQSNASRASRASSQPPLRPLQSQDSHARGGGCSAESSRANTPSGPSCPTWAVVDSDAVQAAPARPRPHAARSHAVPQLTKLPRAASQPVRQRPPAALPSQGSRESSRATSPRCPDWHIGDADENPPALEEEVLSMSPRTAAGLCETPAPPDNMQSVPKPWKQKAIQVNSASYYLEALKAARGGRGTPSAAGRPAPGSRGYAEQMRLRAEDVEAKQREEQDTRMERGYAALQRVQQRGMQASPVRSSMA
ncbi:Reticulocyte-binding protein 2-like a [Symbiodinium microadriaticum]|uniref:Reticulocyte-binding protein 2-like a n=1 Tax=Symbiodinium microadriaticum TaxID=2951 RepID=A0A1Q9CQM9_SYMMI|nr:Reticulocyte-binding protein 2-like a [Symbiodinium microadriaticum]CAE7871984.1 unnamed protein product [Symbiodinium microadriaticum]CAE7918288.1 unnamed protein product [Symbiodinium sp. KB8]